MEVKRDGDKPTVQTSSAEVERGSQGLNPWGKLPEGVRGRSPIHMAN